MIRPVVLCAALLALAACDTGEPDDELVGTWTLSAGTTRELATVSVSQRVLDASLPPEGAASVSGSETAQAFYLNYVSRYGDVIEFALLSYDPNAATYPDRRHYVMVADGQGYRGVRLLAEDASEYLEYGMPEGSAAAFTRSDWSFAFQSVPLVAYDGSGRTARVGGTVALGSRSLAAGAPNVLSEYRFDLGEPHRISYTLAADGTLTIRETEGNRSVERVGSWERVGDRVRLSVPIENGTATETLEYGISFDGAVLVLTDDDVGPSCDAACRESVEYSWGMQPGTLRSYRSELSIRLVASPPAQAAARAVAPRPPLPSAVRDQLLVRRPGGARPAPLAAVAGE